MATTATLFLLLLLLLPLTAISLAVPDDPAVKFPAECNVLFSGEDLFQYERLSTESCGRRYTFEMQDDCNVVLRDGCWESHTAGRGCRCYLSLDDTGCLQIRDLNRSDALVWSSIAEGGVEGDYAAVLSPEGKVSVYGPCAWSSEGNGNGSFPPPALPPALPPTALPPSAMAPGSGPALAPGPASARGNSDTSADTKSKLGNIPRVNNVLFSGQILYGGGKLSTGQYSAVMRHDCNFYLNKDNLESGTAGAGEGCFLRLDHYGGLAILDDSYQMVWNNSVHMDKGDYVAILKTNGVLSVYGPAIWSTAWDEDYGLAGAASGKGMRAVI